MISMNWSVWEVDRGRRVQGRLKDWVGEVEYGD